MENEIKIMPAQNEKAKEKSLHVCVCLCVWGKMAFFLALAEEERKQTGNRRRKWNTHMCAKHTYTHTQHPLAMLKY